MRKPSLLAMSVAAVAVAALGLAGCSDDDESPQTKASKSASAAAKQTCEDIDQLKADTDKLATADPADTSKEDVQKAVDQLGQDVSALAGSAGNLGAATSAAVKAAADSVKSVLNSVNSGSTVNQTLDAVKKPLQELSATLTATRATAQCGPSAVPSAS